MIVGKISATKKETGSSSLKPDPPKKRRNIEQGIEDIFSRFESKPEIITKRQETIADFADLKIEIATKDIEIPKTVKDTQKPPTAKIIKEPGPKKKKLTKLRPVYVAGGVLIVAVALTFTMINPQQAPPPDKYPVTETPYKIVPSVPPPPMQSPAAQPAQPIPAETRISDEIKTFLLKWKTAWEHAAGKQGDMETFMSFYSDSFTSTGMNKREWENDKILKNRLKEWIRLELNNIRISEIVADDRAEVSFSLTYNSSNYSDETNQTLILKREASAWKISEIKDAKEREVFE